MATDQEVKDQRERVIELRARLEEVKTGGADTQHDLENELVLTQLQTEEARLQAELDAAQQNASPAAMARGVRAPLGTIREQMELAVSQQKAVADEVTAANKNDPPTVVTPVESPSAASTEKTSAAKTTAKVQG